MRQTLDFFDQNSFLLPQFLATGGQSAFKVLAKAHKLLTYKSLRLPTDITTRNVTNIPGYLYRDDALKIWRAIAGCSMPFTFYSRVLITHHCILVCTRRAEPSLH